MFEESDYKVEVGGLWMRSGTACQRRRPVRAFDSFDADGTPVRVHNGSRVIDNAHTSHRSGPIWPASSLSSTRLSLNREY